MGIHALPSLILYAVFDHEDGRNCKNLVQCCIVKLNDKPVGSIICKFGVHIGNTR